MKTRRSGSVLEFAAILGVLLAWSACGFLVGCLPVVMYHAHRIAGHSAPGAPSPRPPLECFAVGGALGSVLHACWACRMFRRYTSARDESAPVPAERRHVRWQFGLRQGMELVAVLAVILSVAAWIMKLPPAQRGDGLLALISLLVLLSFWFVGRWEEYSKIHGMERRVRRFERALDESIRDPQKRALPKYQALARELAEQSERLGRQKVKMESWWCPYFLIRLHRWLGRQLS